MTTIDTHALASRYKAAGFTETQVEAMVTTAREISNLPDISQLVTKEHFDATLNVKIEQAKVQMILAVIAIVGFADGILFFALKH